MSNESEAPREDFVNSSFTIFATLTAEQAPKKNNRNSIKRLFTNNTQSYQKEFQQQFQRIMNDSIS